MTLQEFLAGNPFGGGMNYVKVVPDGFNYVELVLAKFVRHISVDRVRVSVPGFCEYEGREIVDVWKN